MIGKCHPPVERIQFIGAVECNKTNGIFYLEKYRTHICILKYEYTNNGLEKKCLVALEIIKRFHAITALV
jgi:hypothetical protein